MAPKQTTGSPRERQAREQAASCPRTSIMKNRLRNAYVVLVLMSMLPHAPAEKGVYRLDIRRNHQLRREMVNVEAPSFSGDLGPIIKAAEKLANEENNGNGGGTVTDPTSTLVPPSTGRPGDGDNTQGESTTKGCVVGESTFEYFEFTYELETLPTSTATHGREITLQDDDNVEDRLERALNDALADKLLNCPDDGYDANTGIVEFDSLPKDAADESKYRHHSDVDLLLDAGISLSIPHPLYTLQQAVILNI